MEQKTKKQGGQVGIHDPDDRVKDALVEIKEYWETVNHPARYSYSAIVEALVMQYAEYIRNEQPGRIDTKKIFK